MLGADQALGDGVRLGEESRRDLLDAEAADRLESERDAGGRRQRRVATHEHHGQLVVTQRGGLRQGQWGLTTRLDEALELAAQRGLAPQEIERAVPRHLKEPGPRLGGHAAEGPCRERADERVLHCFLGEIEARRAKPARQPRHHLARAVAEEVLDQRADFGRRHAALSLAGSCPRPREPRACRSHRDVDGSRGA